MPPEAAPAVSSTTGPAPTAAIASSRASNRAAAVAMLAKTKASHAEPSSTPAAEAGPAKAAPTVKSSAAPPGAADARAKAEQEFRARADRLEASQKAREAARADAAKVAKRDEDFAARQKQLEDEYADPRAVLARQGYTPKRIVEEAIKEGSPEAMAEARIKAAEDRADKLEKEWSDFRKTGEEQQTKAQQEARQAESQRIFTEKRAEVVGLLNSRDDLPTLIDMPDDYVILRAFKLADQYWQDTIDPKTGRGEHPDMGALLKYLDGVLKREKASWQGSRQGAAKVSSAAEAPPAKVAGTSRPTGHAPPKPTGRSAREDRRAKAMADLRRAKG
jgi:hypothetical protein